MMTQTRKGYDRRFKTAAARVVLDRGKSVRELSEGLGIKDSTLRRWAHECERMGVRAFPGNGSVKINRDHGIVRLRERVEELEKESEPLKKFRAFLRSDRT
jgi:transposase-like protein